jgi:death-on-curing protein
MIFWSVGRRFTAASPGSGVVAFLSKVQVLRVHQKLIERFGGIAGVRDAGALEAALERPQATFEGEDLYTTVGEKAAALFHSLVTNHPFTDGNKRTAALCAELFVLVNGFDLLATDEELEELTMATARGEREAAEVAIWLEQRLRPLP